MADNYTDQFLTMHKRNLQIDEERQKAGEEALRKREQEKKELATVAAKTPTLWNEIRQFLQSKVAEINQQEKTAQLRFTGNLADELRFQYRNQTVLVKYDRQSHKIIVCTPAPNSKWSIDETFIPIVVEDGAAVRFADPSRNPVDYEAIWGSVMKIIIKSGAQG